MPTVKNRSTKNWRISVAAGLMCALAGIASVPERASAQSTWQAEGSSEGEAVDKYREMLEADPKEGYVLESLLNKVGRGDQLDGLIADYKQRVESNPEAVNLRLVLGHLLKARRDWEAAIAQYDKVIELSPDRPQPYASRGDIYLRTQKVRRAREDFERALERVESSDRKERLLRKLANLAVQQREFEAADDYYTQLIELKSGDRYIRLEYASTLMEAQKFERAAEQYKRVVDASTNPGDRISALKSLGDAYRKMGRMEEAVGTYRRGMSMVRASNWRHEELRDRVISVRRQQDALPELLERYRRQFGRPNYRQALLLGRLSDEVGQTERAIEAYTRARGLRPSETEPREKLIELWRRQGKEERVRSAYRQLVEVAPGESRYYFELVRLNMRRGATDEAKSWLERIRRRFRGRPDVYVQVADTYMQYGWEEGALEVYRQLVQMEPDNPSYIISYGETLYRQGSLEEAVEAWRRLLEASMPAAEAHARLGRVFAEHGMFERSISQFNKAVESAPEDLQYRRGLASTYERAKQWNQAESTWREVLERVETPRRRSEARGRIIDIYRKQHRLRSKLDEFRREFDGTQQKQEAGYFLAEGHLRLGRFDRALQTYETIIRLDGEVDAEDVEALIALEQIYRQQGKWKEAIEQLEQLAELRPKYRRDYYHRIAELSLKLYMDQQAVEYAMKAVEANPQSAEAYARLGEVYRKMGSIDRAIETYREAWQLNQQAYGHAMKLAKMLEGRGDWEEAFEMYRRVARESGDRARLLEAARRAIDLAERTDRMTELERSIAQLVFSGRKESVYRKVMLELYERMLSPWRAVGEAATDASDEEGAAIEDIATRAVPILVDALTSDDISQRASAVRLLGRLGSKSAAVPLARMVVDSGEPLRMAAASSLVRIGAPRAAGALASGLDASDPDIREATIWALGHVGGARSRELLVEVLESGQNSKERALAAIGLGRIGGAGVAEALAATLSGDGAESEAVRLAGYWALGRAGGVKAVSVVADGLERGSERVRSVAAVALGRIGSRIGGSAASQQLLETLWSGRQRQRRAARLGLRWLFVRGTDEPEAAGRRLEAELRLLNARDQTFNAEGVLGVLSAEARREPTGGVRDGVFGASGATIQQVAARHLNKESDVGREVVSDLVLSTGELGLLQMTPPSPGGREAYRRALEPLADDVRAWVIEAKGDRALGLSFVGRVAPSEHREWLVEHLDHARATVRAEAIQAAARLGESEAVLRQLTGRLEDESVVVRAAACAAWRQYDPSMVRSTIDGAVEVMAGQLDDAATSVQFEAARTLGHLGGEEAVEALAGRVGALRRPARREALRVLEASDHPSARQVLETYRSHWDVELRESAGSLDR